MILCLIPKKTDVSIFKLMLRRTWAIQSQRKLLSQKLMGIDQDPFTENHVKKFGIVRSGIRFDRQHDYYLCIDQLVDVDWEPHKQPKLSFLSLDSWISRMRGVELWNIIRTGFGLLPHFADITGPKLLCACNQSPKEYMKVMIIMMTQL